MQRCQKLNLNLGENSDLGDLAVTEEKLVITCLSFAINYPSKSGFKLSHHLFSPESEAIQMRSQSIKFTTQHLQGQEGVWNRWVRGNNPKQTQNK